MILPLYASLEKLDLSLLEASADLGASRASTFWRVTVPLTMPGIVAGIILVFVPSLGPVHRVGPPGRRADDPRRQPHPESVRRGAQQALRLGRGVRADSGGAAAAVCLHALHPRSRDRTCCCEGDAEGSCGRTPGWSMSSSTLRSPSWSSSRSTARPRPPSGRASRSSGTAACPQRAHPDGGAQQPDRRSGRDDSRDRVRYSGGARPRPLRVPRPGLHEATCCTCRSSSRRSSSAPRWSRSSACSA